jgi:hypothetical protein
VPRLGDADEGVLHANDLGDLQVLFEFVLSIQPRFRAGAIGWRFLRPRDREHPHELDDTQSNDDSSWNS